MPYQKRLLIERIQFSIPTGKLYNMQTYFQMTVIFVELVKKN